MTHVHTKTPVQTLLFWCYLGNLQCYARHYGLCFRRSTLESGNGSEQTWSTFIYHQWLIAKALQKKA